MRCSCSERVCTFFFTTLLFLLSFTESANAHGFRAHHAWRRRAVLDVSPRDQVASSIPQVLPTNVLPTTTISSPSTVLLPTISLPSLLPSSLPAPPSLPTSTTLNSATTSTSSETSIPSHTSVPPTITTSTTSSQVQTTNNVTPLSQSTSSQSSSSQPSSSQSSSSSQSTPSAALSASTTATVGGTTLGAQKSVTQGYAASITSHLTGSQISVSPSTTSTSSSNSGFFSNTGAVAGTFTVAGLLGVAGIIGAGMLIARRRVSRSYDDDMEYLEKKPERAVEVSQSQDFVVGDVGDFSESSQFNNSMDVTVPPMAHLYPQHNVYLAHEQTPNRSDGYGNQEYYPQEAYTPEEYGIAYPPRESYAAEDDAYGGMDNAYAGMPNPFDDASGLPGALRPSGQQLLTVGPPHTAQHLQDPHHSVDSFYGSSAGA